MENIPIANVTMITVPDENGTPTLWRVTHQDNVVKLVEKYVPNNRGMTPLPAWMGDDHEESHW